jgi:16S rRNA (guanine1207-N2)-methyltransferase
MTSDGFDAALVQIVKSKARTLSAVAEAFGAVAPGGLILIDGAKEEGIESVLKALKPQCRDRRRVLQGPWQADLVPPSRQRSRTAIADWIALPTEIEEGYVTAPGGFSSDGPDRGSEILVALVPPLKGRSRISARAGGISAGEILAEQEGITHLDLIEADHDMLEAARANIDDPRAAFHWADVTRFAPEEPYDAIIANPPFHTGRRADPGPWAGLHLGGGPHAEAVGQIHHGGQPPSAL